MSPHDPPVAAAHDALAPLLPILDAFNHRHRNQHRTSHWWSQFNILRRSLRNLLPHLRARRENPILTRSRWLSRHAIPQCYLVFSQLTADNQYAPLGLLLLSVLARLSAEITALLPDEKPRAVDALARTTPDVTLSSLTQDHDADRGTAISRHDVVVKYDRPEDLEKPSKSKAVKSKSAKPGKGDKKQKKASSKKKDEFSSLFGSLS
ncbi:hypothetical protein B0I35DRAFT_483489 [Stachybotrys elegans]|uniref:RNase MRP protein 1 RNA binding domain-containing protein n=1 Tax=Stachybotrys elegans TaxID=80388 RepID=A0A8K0SF89_9HYPO|nr:hypothetical protein B0I35DRAFT_483489 [Stachybotrys elegans]